VLKHHRDTAIARWQSIDTTTADANLAFIHRLKSSDHAQQRRLAASRRTEKYDELVRADRQRHIVEYLRDSKRFTDIDDFSRRHFNPGCR
jgi:hypothetical protein